MKNGTVKNPLRKRIWRELTGEWRKYAVVSFFLILMIGFVSGMYVANGSMLQAAEDGMTIYKCENGHFKLNKEADQIFLSELIRACEEQQLSLKVYENFYKNVEEDNNNDGAMDGTIRVYKKSEAVNLACLMDGELPGREDEIAIDRMHADNADIKIGDMITLDGVSYTVSGLLAYVNYSTLHEKNTDLIFDALKFDVGMLTEDGFERLKAETHHSYAWCYDKAFADEKEEKEMSEKLLKVLLKQTTAEEMQMEEFIPRYANAAINFATEDMGSDKAMGGVLLDILIVIIAFIFAVTISNTMTKEASAIGTLRASGYTRGELIRHFLSMPVVVTLLSAIIGNVLGYTVFKEVVVSMYYNSYSLPKYQTIWSAEAFLKTTLIPVVLMLVVNLIVIIRMMQHTPQQFLRQDLKKKKKKKAIGIAFKGFLNRFRIRIILQNLPDYGILFIGICFIMVMLAMAVGMPSTLDYYKKHAQELMFADYQYVLKSSVDADGRRIVTDTPQAEAFSMCSLEIKSEELTEEVSVYGISADSQYVVLDPLSSLEETKVYISQAFAEKYNIEVGADISLEEKYEDTKYKFHVAGIYDNCQSIAVFMPIENYRSVFDVEEGVFTGYFSDEKIEDIPDEWVATVITKREITKMCDQLDHSMGSYMTYFQYLCVLLSAALIYLLTKLVIEKNESAISMTKILGYKNRELAGIYLFSTTLVVLLEAVISVAIGSGIMKLAWKKIMAGYSGWFSFIMEPAGYEKMFTFVMAGYLLVLYFDFRRIKRIPLDEALKAVE